MPVCSVKVCKNRSSQVNYKTNGTTYHRFPFEPNLIKKWIKATGRSGDDWCPTISSTICSQHFEEKFFQPLKTSRRLFPWAVPTLKLRLITLKHEVSTSSDESNNASKRQPTDKEDHKILNLKKVIHRNFKMLDIQKRRIKCLKLTLKRYKKNIAVMQDLIDDIKQRNEET